jgi:hypothetical protein
MQFLYMHVCVLVTVCILFQFGSYQILTNAMYTVYSSSGCKHEFDESQVEVARLEIACLRFSFVSDDGASDFVAVHS